jgi:hypothetical protein
MNHLIKVPLFSVLIFGAMAGPIHADMWDMFKSKYPKAVSDLIGHDLSEVNTKFGPFLNEPQLGEYAHVGNVSPCLWEGLTVFTDMKTQKVTSIEHGWTGQCNGAADEPLISKVLPDLTMPTEIEKIGQSMGDVMYTARWIKGSDVVIVKANCAEAQVRAGAFRFRDCHVHTLSAGPARSDYVPSKKFDITF